MPEVTSAGAGCRVVQVEMIRYADDLRAFVRSEPAAHWVFGNVTDVVEGWLKL